jgi:protein TonB
MTGIVSNLGKAFSKKKPAAEKVETTSESKSAAVQATPKRESRKTPPPAKAPAEPAPAKADNPLRASHSLGTSQTLRPAMDDRLNTSFGESGGGSSIWSNPKILGAGAAAIVAVLAIGFWIFSGGDEEAPVARKTASTSQASVTETEIANTGRPRQTSASPGAAADLLAEAQLAEQAGQIFNPPGSNAIELYAAAREAAPDNAEIAEKFSAVLGLALSQAESAMLERRADDAAAALDRVALVDPQNSRLPFLTAQLSQMQMRNYVDTARTAIRESRFEDAANAISAANLLDVTDRTDLATVADELSAARSAQQVDDVLAAAADRLEQGKLTAPSNDNARYFYELVLSNQPDNTAAQQGLTAVASKLVLQARAEIDQGRFDRASALLDDARVLDPSSSEVSDATEALEESRARVAAEQRQREAQQRAAEQREQDRLLAEQQAEAERRAAAVEAARSTKDTEEDTVADNAAETVTTAVAGTAASTSPDPTAPRSRPPVERPQATEPEGPVAISSLTRIKYVAPKYPRAAERRELSGWVDVVFTVALDGTTRDIQVRDSDPGDMFVDSAVRAIERWEFEPVLENGAPVEKTAGVRMMFALE